MERFFSIVLIIFGTSVIIILPGIMILRYAIPGIPILFDEFWMVKDTINSALFAIIATIVAWVLYAAIAIHIIDALLITLNNKKAKGEKYVVTDNSTSTWISRNMGLIGTVIGVFIIMHMAQFWLQYKVLKIEHDLYNLVIETFKVWWMVALYEIGIIALGLHIIHGIESAHRSLGIYPKKTMNIIKYIALYFGLIMAILYAIIPIILYFK